MDGLYWKTLLKMDDLGLPYFWKHTYVFTSCLPFLRCASAWPTGSAQQPAYHPTAMRYAMMGP